MEVRRSRSRSMTLLDFCVVRRPTLGCEPGHDRARIRLAPRGCYRTWLQWCGLSGADPPAGCCAQRL